MTQFDVFNGDADGICSLHQLRLANPRESVLITGVKRDISLVKHVRAEAGDSVTILDISMEKNHADLLKVLSDGAQCEYFDHHFPGEIPEHAALQTHIDTAAETCTGLIVNKHLDGQHLPWAVTAAFGDNLDVAAKDAAAPLKLTNTEIAQLKTLGILLNYNGYGASIEDLFFPPANLYLRVNPTPARLISLKKMMPTRRSMKATGMIVSVWKPSTQKQQTTYSPCISCPTIRLHDASAVFMQTNWLAPIPIGPMPC